MPDTQTSPLATGSGVALLIFMSFLTAGILYQGLFPALYYLVDIVALFGLWGLVLLLGLVRSLVLALRRVSPWDRWLALALVLVVATTGAVLTRLPMVLGFLTVQPTLEQVVGRGGTLTGPVGLYDFEPGPTRDFCDSPEYQLFPLRAAGDQAAFVYAPGGIGGLCYNSGSAGHLTGDWYWKVDD